MKLTTTNTMPRWRHNKNKIAEKIGQGRENAKIYLKEHPDIMAEINAKVRK